MNKKEKNYELFCLIEKDMKEKIVKYIKDFFLLDKIKEIREEKWVPAYDNTNNNKEKTYIFFIITSNGERVSFFNKKIQKDFSSNFLFRYDLRRSKIK